MRALPLFRWSPTQIKRVEAILLENARTPSLFVRAWAVDSLATLSETRAGLRPIVEQHLVEFEHAPSKALRARALRIRERLAAHDTPAA